MTAQRAHTRYRANDFDCLKAWFVESEAPLRLVSLGKGGCGFLSRELLKTPKMKSSVGCWIELAGFSRKPVFVEGEVVSIEKMKYGTYDAFVYGVQFSGVSKAKIEDLIEYLEENRIKL